VVANSTRVQFGAPVKKKSLRMVARGRVCRTDGCATVLSIYNEAFDCSLHEGRSVKARRDRI